MFDVGCSQFSSLDTARPSCLGCNQPRRFGYVANPAAVFLFFPAGGVKKESSISRAVINELWPGIQLAKDAHVLPGKHLIRSIEIVVIALKPHLDERDIVQFNMGVAKQEVHALEVAVERVASAAA